MLDINTSKKSKIICAIKSKKSQSCFNLPLLKDITPYL